MAGYTAALPVEKFEDPALRAYVRKKTVCVLCKLRDRGRYGRRRFYLRAAAGEDQRSEACKYCNGMFHLLKKYFNRVFCQGGNPWEGDKDAGAVEADVRDGLATETDSLRELPDAFKDKIDFPLRGHPFV